MAKRPLVQELMLLGLDDDGRVVGRNPAFDYALAGAVLLELALAERIDVADKRVVPLRGASLREPVLDDALTAVARLSAVMQSGAITVTRLWSVSPRPVFGSMMCE